MDSRLATVVIAAMIVGCAPPPPPGTFHPAGPGLLDGRPPQPPESYRVVGWVLEDQSGRPIEGAQVILLGTARVTQTDRYGRYLLDSVPFLKDSIQVRVQLIGYEREQRTFHLKRPMGLTIGPWPSFVDTLNFWLRWRPLPVM